MATAHDLAAIYERIWADYGLPAARLPDLVTAVMVVSWLAAKHVQPPLAQIEGVRRQVESALHATLPRLDPGLVREARVAMQCHFAIIFRANAIGRASGDPRQFEELDVVAREWCAAVFGRDIRDFEVTPDGFVRASANPSQSRGGGTRRKTPAHVRSDAPMARVAGPSS